MIGSDHSAPSVGKGVPRAECREGLQKSSAAGVFEHIAQTRHLQKPTETNREHQLFVSRG